MTTVTQKGQITIPVELRRRFGLRKGTPCTFMVRNNQIVLVPLKTNMTIEDYEQLFREGLKDTEDFLTYKRKEKQLEKF